MKIVLRAGLPVLAATLLLSGCGGGDSSGTAASTAAATPAAGTSATAEPSTAATATATATGGDTKPKGFTVVADAADGFQIAVPSGYVRITKKADLDKVISAGKKFTDASGLTAQLANKSLKVLAVNPATSSSVNVIVAGAGGMTPDQLPLLEGTFKDQVEKIGAKGVSFRKTTVAAEPALRVGYVLKAQGKNISTVQYISVHDDSIYTTTLAGPFQMSAKVEKETIGSWRYV